MHNARIYVFRIDYQNENEFVKSELAQGRLRQGWGPIPLRKGDTIDYAPGSFTAGMVARWPGTSTVEAESRYRILYPMLEMSAGDLIVIPKFPEPYGRSFAIAQVTAAYRFDPTPFDDYGHCITVDASTIKTFEHDESLDAKRVSAKFTSYRSAVNNVWNEGFIQAVMELWTGSRDPEQANARWSTELKQYTLTHSKAVLASLPPGALEELVTSAFEEAGYKFLQRHHYDGQGGDADLVLSVRLPLLSDLQDASLKVFVQVKKREGDDLDDGHGLEQLERIAADEPMALKILFSTAAEFSEETRLAAQQNGVVLIGGDAAASLLARSLLRTAA